MNERLIIQLQQDGNQLPVTGLSNDGISLGNEDVFPSGLVLQIDGNDAATRQALDRVRVLNDWKPQEFRLDCHVESGDLVFSGVTARALPAGNYGFRLRIADYLLPSTQFECVIPEDGVGHQVVEARRDPRRFELTGEVSTFDADIQRVLTHAESRVDGRSIADWLTSSARDRRKACLLNVMAKLRAVPSETEPLIKNVRFVFFANVDRIYAATDLEYHSRLQTLSKGPNKKFFEEGSPADSGHRKLLLRIGRFEPDAEHNFRLRSFRQAGQNSFQSVVAVPGEQSGITRCYSDMDIDLGNPLQDVAGFVIHMGELLDPGTTDHLALFQKLFNDVSIRPFLFYRVIV
jgi:hypothetical protein